MVTISLATILTAPVPCWCQATLVATLGADDGVADDYFGGSTKSGGPGAISIHGDVIVVGASPSGDAEFGPGAAYVFERDAGGSNRWGQVAKLTGPNEAAIGLFGSSVAVYQDRIAVSDPIEGLPADATECDTSGAIYVYGRNADDVPAPWTNLTKLTADSSACLGSGEIALDDELMVVGASWANRSTGAAYVFSHDRDGAGGWVAEATLAAQDGAPNEFLGSVGFSGNTMLAGAALDSDGGQWTGSVYVFERSGPGQTDWQEVDKLLPSDSSAGDWFGTSLDVDGDTAIIGASRSGVPGSRGTREGAAYILDRNAGGMGVWGEVAILGASDDEPGDSFGEATALSGDLAIVGARRDANHDGFAEGPGSAYVFGRHVGGPNRWGEMLAFPHQTETMTTTSEKRWTFMAISLWLRRPAQTMAREARTSLKSPKCQRSPVI